jgi:hypothetical protein
LAFIARTKREIKIEKEREIAKDNNEDRKEETKKERKRNKENERKPLELAPRAKPLPACLQLLLPAINTF